MKDILDAARAAVDAHAEEYGDPAVNLSEIAGMWSIILRKEVTSRQVCACMVALKLSRLARDPKHFDSWVDVAGYAQCAGEV